VEEVDPQQVYWELYGFDIRRVGADWLTKDQLLMLFDSMDREQDRLLFGLLAETGAKLGEVLGLKKADFEAELLTLPGRTVPIPESIQDLVVTAPDPLFQVTPRQVQRRIRSLGEAVNLKVSTHIFRASFAVHWLVARRDAGDLAYALGYNDFRGVQRLLQLEPPEQTEFHNPGVLNVRR
jgi:integrase